MHRIWSIPELVDLTFDFLAIRDAAAAATVCRSFWLTALAHIWRDIDDFSNLLNLLPKIPLFPCYGSDVLAFAPERRLQESEWERFLLHSKYTKSLSVFLDHKTLEAILRLLPSLPRAPIFPNLSSTELKLASSLRGLSLELVSLFWPQTVSEVRISFVRQDSESSVRRILQMLAKDIELPSFRSFSINGLDCFSPDVRASISQVLQSRPDIQAVKIGLDLGPDVMEILNAAGELPGLRHLDLRVLRNTFTAQQTPRLLFPALETINIAGPLPFIDAALGCAGPENMHSVRMAVKKSPPSQHQGVGDTFLLSKCLAFTERLTHLKTLDLESEVPVSMGDLRHVLTCRDIETIRIVGRELPSPEDWESLFGQMAEAWSRLMKSEIRPTSFPAYEGVLLGLSHLQVLATKCRALRWLCIAVVARERRNPLTLELDNGARFANNVMQKLEVACALRGDVTEMWLVMILRILWPGLHVVSCDRTGSSDDRSMALNVTLVR